MKISIYLDGANKQDIVKNANHYLISGFTTNPSLVRKSGVTNYLDFAKELSDLIPKDKTVSFEVISDDFDEMISQGRKIAKISDNFYVKIPVVNTQGRYTNKVIEYLGKDGVKLNITAIMHPFQIRDVYKFVNSNVPNIFSVFFGRIADTGCDPMNVYYHFHSYLDNKSMILWASCREVLNIYTAEEFGCDIITVAPDIFNKFQKLRGKNLFDYSKETVKDFYKDAIAAGYSL